MSYGDIEQPTIWKAFFDGIPTDKYSIYLHRADGVRTSWCDSANVIDFIPSKYATWSLVEISQALMTAGLHDDNNQIFILLSGDTIPIVPFNHVSQN